MSKHISYILGFFWVWSSHSCPQQSDWSLTYTAKLCCLLLILPPLCNHVNKVDRMILVDRVGRISRKGPWESYSLIPRTCDWDITSMIGQIDLKKGRLPCDFVSRELFPVSIKRGRQREKNQSLSTGTIWRAILLTLRWSNDQECRCCLGAKRGSQLTGSW